MASNLDIDQELIAEAMKVGKFKTKKRAVNEALKHFVQHVKQKGIKKLQGKVEFAAGYDYKKHRMK